MEFHKAHLAPHYCISLRTHRYKSSTPLVNHKHDPLIKYYEKYYWAGQKVPGTQETAINAWTRFLKVKRKKKFKHKSKPQFCQSHRFLVTHHLLLSPSLLGVLAYALGFQQDPQCWLWWHPGLLLEKWLYHQILKSIRAQGYQRPYY